jgi:hypothetical protein
MLAPSYARSPEQRWRDIGTADAPRLLDARGRDEDERPSGTLQVKARAVW